MLRLDALTEEECVQFGALRNNESVRLGLRTSHLTSEAGQRAFYRDVVTNPRAPHRYYAVREGSECVAMVGLTDISWENGHAEVSLLVLPAHRRSGVGEVAVNLILEEAFGRMRLMTVFGEVYEHNPALAFWEKQVERMAGGSVRVPRRKWWNGELHGSMFFWFAAPR